MATKKDGMLGRLLVLVGALVYVYLVYNLVKSGGPLNGGTLPAWLGGAMAIWAPIVGGLAVISAITLLILSLVELAGWSDSNSGKRRGKAIWWGGFALLILTVGGGWFWWAVIGFVLAYVGSGWLDMM